MKKAANWEYSASKHPVTPGEVLPARELYEDLLLELHQTKAAFQEYEAVLCDGRSTVQQAGVKCGKIVFKEGLGRIIGLSLPGTKKPLVLPAVYIL